MKRTFLIALSMLRIRRLFFSLILIPLVLSLLVVTIQVFASTMIMRVSEKSSRVSPQKTEPGLNFLRLIALGREQPFPAPLICRWKTVTNDTGVAIEEPPSQECDPDRLDAAIQVNDPESYDPQEYLGILSGSVARIHLCRTCSPDLLFKNNSIERRVEIRGIWSALIAGLMSQNTAVTEAYDLARRSNDRIKSIMGKKYFIAPGFRGPINISDIRSTLLFVFNVASLIVVSLWLALKAHRRVLDYFSQNGALLPMVAANGKDTFYGALWIITLLRVVAFLASAAPLMLYSLHEYIFDRAAQEVLGANPGVTVLWCCALVTSLSLATLIASIADLRQRSHLLTFLYRFFPLILALIGALIWSITFVLEGNISPLIRTIVSCLPVIGIMPIFISLIFQPHLLALFAHSILSIALIIYLMRLNARWFGAHLEEI